MTMTATTATTYINDKIVVCVLENILTADEDVLAADGAQGAVIDGRVAISVRGRGARPEERLQNGPLRCARRRQLANDPPEMIRAAVISGLDHADCGGAHATLGVSHWGLRGHPHQHGQGSAADRVASLCRCKFVRGLGSRSEFRVAGVVVFVSLLSGA